VRKAVTVGGSALLLLTLTVAGAAAVQHVYNDWRFSRLMSAGDRALAAGDAYSAVEAFSGALALRPEAMVAYLRRGEAYRDQQRLDQAVRDWRQAARLAPEAPQAFMAIGDVLDISGRSSEAADWYTQAAERLRGEDPSLLYRLALARYKSGAPGGALEPLREAVARDDSSAQARYLLGLVYRDIGNPTAAMTSLEAALAIDPDLVAAREELAELYRLQDRPVEEMAQLQSIGARDARPARRAALGLAEARQGQIDSAVGTLSRALDAAPNDPRLQLAIGRVYLLRAERHNARDPDAIRRARAVLERALAGSAPRSEGLALYGRALYLDGDDPAAERALREAVSTSPVAPEAFAFLADAAERLGHDLIARDALMNFDTLHGDTMERPARTARAQRIGELSLRIDDPRTALEYLTRAAEAGDRTALTAGLLAHARWLTGDVEGARALLARALKEDPRDPKIQRIAKVVR